MKSFRQPGPHESDEQRSAADPEVRELDGFCALGMKRDALRLARRILNRPRLSAEAFNSAVFTPLMFSNRLGPWKPRVEAAYDRVAKRHRAGVRHTMLTFAVQVDDFQRAGQFLPRRFSTTCALLDLAFAMQVKLNLGDLVGAIWAYLSQRNLKPQRYEWRAEGRAILEKIRRAREALARQPTVTKDNSEAMH
jgi:hypothetical protein